MHPFAPTDPIEKEDNLMKKKYLIPLTSLTCILVMVACAACSAPKANTDGSSSASSNVSYSDDSLIAYHKTIGKDISNLTEVSAADCGQCHGDWDKIQSETTTALTCTGSVQDETANPHENHMTPSIECSDCHSLTSTSSLMCDESCHEWTIAKNNGTWGAGESSLK